jgi:transposase-like protein
MSVRIYSDEFKRQAVELAESLKSYSRAAEQLGIPKTNIYAWKRPLKVGSSPAAGNTEVLTSDQEELRRLRRENSELKQVNILLKSAAAFFSQDHLKKSIF